MHRVSWKAVDEHIERVLVKPDEALDAALKANAAAGLPAIDVTAAAGKLLHLIARMAQARNVLEIGTLGGFSTIWLAHAVGPEGRVVSLEREPAHADIARANLARAGVLDRVEIRLGTALDLLPGLSPLAPFDLFFVDADKENNPNYLSAALDLARPGSVVVFDNVVRDGKVIDATSLDPDIIGTRRLMEAAGNDPRLTATALQTVGAKGWDGFLLGVVEG